MPTAAAVDYATTASLARQNVWSLFGAGNILRNDLDGWRQALFALPFDGAGIPARLLIWEAPMLEVISGLPTTAPAAGEDFIPSPVIKIIRQTSLAFENDPVLGIDVAFEAAYVAAWNTAWV